MTINPNDLISLRNEYSLISYGPRCFAILFGDSGCLQTLKRYIDKINAFSPHRVKLSLSQRYTQHTVKAFVIVEMGYKTPVQQMYFTFLMWEISSFSPLWIHIWDTLEHDALRRDFQTPEFMDSELSINRLWVKCQNVHLIQNGYSHDNPHGEYVSEIRLCEAIEILESGNSVKIISLSNQLNTRFSSTENQHLLGQVSDVENVYIPKSMVYLVTQHPSWIEYPDYEYFDPTHIQLDALPSCIDLQDENMFTVAVSDVDFEGRYEDKNSEKENPELFTKSLSKAQWVSVMIKVNANKAFFDARNSPQETNKLMICLGKKAPSSSFQSSFLMPRLLNFASCGSSITAKLIKDENTQLKKDWRNTVNVLTEEDTKTYEKLQQESFGDSDLIDPYPIKNTEKPANQETPFFVGLEDTKSFTHDFVNCDILKKISAAMEDPELIFKTPQAVTEADLEKTADLEYFDDFVEFYARQFMGFKDSDLERYRVKKSKDFPCTNSGFDWRSYNDESEYESG